MDIKLDEYKIFCIVARCESFSRAARELFMTQSAVSQHIKNLESSLGVTLFIRGRTGASLTSQGRMLLEYAENALSLLTSVENQFEKMGSLEDGALRIGAGDTISKHYLLPALEKFHECYPKINLSIVNRVTSETLELLRSGKVDLAFVNLPLDGETVNMRGELDVLPALTLHDVFVAGSRFSELKNKKLSPEELCSLPLIMLEAISNSRRYVDEFYLTNGVRLEPEIELGSHDLLLDFAAGNLGVSCVVREFSDGYMKSGGLFELDVLSPPPRSIGICTLHGVTLAAAADRFLEILGAHKI